MNEQRNSDTTNTGEESRSESRSAPTQSVGDRAKGAWTRLSREVGPVVEATTAHLSLVGQYITHRISHMRHQLRVRSEQARLGATLYADGAGTDQCREMIRGIDEALAERKGKPTFLNWNLQQTRAARCRDLADSAAEHETDSPEVLEGRQSFDAAKTAAESSKQVVGATMSQLTAAEGPERTRLFWGYGTIILGGILLSALFRPSETTTASLLDAEEHFANGVISYNAENFEVAIEHADDCLDESPTHHGAFHLRGLCFHKLEDFEAAERNFEDALEVHPECEHCWTRLALARLTDTEAWEHVTRLTNAYWAVLIDTRRESGGSLIDNQRLAEQALEANPDSPVAHWLQGNVRQASENWDAAIEAYDRAIELDSEFVLPYLVRAYCYRNTHRVDDEQRDLLRAVELAPDLGTTHLQLFYHLQRSSAPYEEQLQALNRAVETAPRHGEGLFYAYYNRALVHHAISVGGAPEHYEQALQDLSVALQVQHDPGWKLFTGGGGAETLDRFEPLAQARHDDAFAWYMYGSGAAANLDEDQIQASVAAITRWSQQMAQEFGGDLPPTDPSQIPNNVRSLPESAVEWAARLDNQFTPPMLLAGVWLVQGQQIEQGLAWYKKAAATEHCPPFVFSQIVELSLYPAQDIEAARQFADEALARFPDDPACLLAMAKVRIADEEYEDATSHILSALERAPWGRSAGPFDVSEAMALLSVVRRLESDDATADLILSAALAIGNSPLANLEEGKRRLRAGEERLAGERLRTAWYGASIYNQVRQEAADVGQELFCSQCGGNGEILVTGQYSGTGSSGTTQEYRPCPRCRGDGLEPGLD